jgi:hypothetical protein
VRGDHERRACSERSGEPRRHEEVRVGDVGSEATGYACRVEEELRMAPSPSARVDDGALDLVPSPEELTLEARDEDAEIRVVRARIHLGDEEDAHRAAIVTVSAQKRGWETRTVPSMEEPDAIDYTFVDPSVEVGQWANLTRARRGRLRAA